MLLIVVAWLFVVLLLAAVQAVSPQGGWLTALGTLLGYGLVPLAIVLYVLYVLDWRGLRAKRRRAAAATSSAQRAPGDGSIDDADGRRHAAGSGVAPERIKP